MDKSVKQYLANIGSKGGKKSKRKLSPKEARNMVLVREARRAFKKYFTSCFWSYSSDFNIRLNDVSWVSEQLMKHGNRSAWELGNKLCQ